MTQPYVTYGAAAGQRDFDVPFPYINRAHVKVRVNGASVLPFSWPTPTRLRLSAGVTAGAVVEIERDTPIEEQLVKFQDGNILTAEDLNIAVQQMLYKQQEVAGLYERSLKAGLVRVGENLGIVTNPEDVVQELAELVLEDEVLNNFRQRIADINLNAESILAQAFELERVDTSVQAAYTNITALQETTDTAISALTTGVGSVDTRLSALRSDHQSLVSLVDALAGGDAGTGIATLIQEERTERIDGDTALASTISLIGARSPDGLSFVLDTNTTRVSPAETLAQRLSAISATSAGNAAAITNEQTARISADNALASDIVTLYSRTGANESAITSESTARTNGDAALASQITTLTARTGAAEADIVANRTAAASASSAIAAELSLLGVKNGANNAFVINTATAQIGGGVTLASRFSALSSADANNVALIQSEEQARINADGVLTSSVNSLGARMGSAESAIVNEQNARAAGDAAEATARQALAARVASTESEISAAEAAIVNEQTARVNGDSALSGTLTALTARVSTAEGGINTARADILAEATARASGDTANATALNGLSARLGTAEGDINAVEAAIVSEQSARVSADSALAQSISTLTTTVNGNTSSVSTLTQSINGLRARYGVSLDVNGYVTGFVQNNDGLSGSFVVLADRFAVVTPGAAPQTPFEVSGGVVRIKEANIGTLNVARLTSGTLSAGITQNGDWMVGTGRIIWDNGTHMKVAGVGFGSSGQFIEWFGPKMDIALCNEANAITYLKTNGDAYFGGALSAGILKNSAQGTAIASNAEVVVGPFGSNGGIRQVVASYSLRHIGQHYEPGSGSGSTTAQIVVERRVGGGGWVQVASFNAAINASWFGSFGPSEPGTVSAQGSGSTTFSDTLLTTSTVEYRARLTGRPLPPYPPPVDAPMQQTISVISTED